MVGQVLETQRLTEPMFSPSPSLPSFSQGFSFSLIISVFPSFPPHCSLLLFFPYPMPLLAQSSCSIPLMWRVKRLQLPLVQSSVPHSVRAVPTATPVCFQTIERHSIVKLRLQNCIFKVYFICEAHEVGGGQVQGTLAPEPLTKRSTPLGTEINQL